MAIVSGDILKKFSVVTAAGDTTAGSASASLGDQISTTQITDASLHNLFDAVTGAENAASDVEYRCLFFHNNHASLTWTDVVVWVSSQISGGAVLAIGLDPVGVTAKGSGSAQAATIANESTAPSGVSFSTPTTKGAGLVVGDVAPAEVFAVWVRRTAANTGPVAVDGGDIRAEGDTAA